MRTVSRNDDPIKRQAWFRAVPTYELLNGVLIHTARRHRTETVKHCRFAMIQVRQPHYHTTIIRLRSAFAHACSLRCRSMAIPEVVRYCKHPRLRTWQTGSACNRCYRQSTSGWPVNRSTTLNGRCRVRYPGTESSSPSIIVIHERTL